MQLVGTDEPWRVHWRVCQQRPLYERCSEAAGNVGLGKRLARLPRFRIGGRGVAVNIASVATISIVLSVSPCLSDEPQRG
jgi:hypothetical protein